MTRIERIITQAFVPVVPFSVFIGPNNLQTFDRPPTPVLLTLLLLFAVSVARHKHILDLRDPIPAVLGAYGLILVLVISVHQLIDGSAGWFILYLYLSFIPYLLVVFSIFYGRATDLSRVASIFFHAIIVAQTVSAVVDFELLSAFSGGEYHRPSLFQHRPDGLFFMPTLNATIPMIALLGLAYLEESTRREDPRTSFFAWFSLRGALVLANCIYSGSTTGIVIVPALLVLTALVYAGITARIATSVLGLAVAALLPTLAESSGIYRLSGDYFSYIINDSLKVFWSYASQIPLAHWIGYRHEMNASSIDSNLMYLLSMTGMIGMAAFLLTYLAMLALVRSTGLRLVICAAVISSLHYPVLANQFVHMLMAMLLAHYLMVEVEPHNRGHRRRE